MKTPLKRMACPSSCLANARLLRRMQTHAFAQFLLLSISSLWRRVAVSVAASLCRRHPGVLSGVAYWRSRKPRKGRSVVRPTGFEPAAYRLGICRSIHLSYGRAILGGKISLHTILLVINIHRYTSAYFFDHFYFHQSQDGMVCH